MTKLAPIEYEVARRLRQVGEDRRSLFQRAAEAMSQMELASGNDPLFCDRCTDDPTILPKGIRCWSLPFFKMVVCDQCAAEVRAGGAPMRFQYFDAARTMLALFFDYADLQGLRDEEDARVVIAKFKPKYQEWQRKLPPDHPAKGRHWGAFIAPVFHALVAIREEMQLSEWYALPMGPESKE